MTFRIESTGMSVDANDRLVHNAPRFVCNECGQQVAGARSSDHAKQIHTCPKADK